MDFENSPLNLNNAVWVGKTQLAICEILDLVQTKANDSFSSYTELSQAIPGTFQKVLFL